MFFTINVFIKVISVWIKSVQDVALVDSREKWLPKQVKTFSIERASSRSLRYCSETTNYGADCGYANWESLKVTIATDMQTGESLKVIIATMYCM